MLAEASLITVASLPAKARAGVDIYMPRVWMPQRGSFPQEFPRENKRMKTVGVGKKTVGGMLLIPAPQEAESGGFHIGTQPGQLSDALSKVTF